MLRILIIDDARLARSITRLSLQKGGTIEVLEASAGEEGVARAKAEHPDAILLDVVMPGMDGPHTLHALRRDPATAAIPVIFLTAETSAEEVHRLLGLGARGVLRKPFDPRTLFSDVVGCLASLA